MIKSADFYNTKEQVEYLHPLNPTNTSTSVIRCIHSWPLFLWQSIFIIWFLWERPGDITAILTWTTENNWTSYGPVLGYLALCVSDYFADKKQKSLVSAAALLAKEAKEGCLFLSPDSFYLVKYALSFKITTDL